MITFLFEMGEQGWVTFPLCCPTVTGFLEAVGLFLDILIFVGFFFSYRHQLLVGGGKLGVVGH